MENDDLFSDDDFAEAQKPRTPLDGRFMLTIDQAGDDVNHTAIAGPNSQYLPLICTAGDGNGNSRTLYPKITISTNKSDEKARKGVNYHLARFLGAAGFSPGEAREVARALRAQEPEAGQALVGRAIPALLQPGKSKKGKDITEVVSWGHA